MSAEMLKRAFLRFDEENSKDPNQENFEGRVYPKELLYAQRMSHWLERMAPEAPTAVKLAARSQHICRWMIPRSNYPMDRTGYLKWRTELYQFHAKKAASLLKEVGFEEETIEQVKVLLQKKNLKTEPKMQLLEDVICLVFLEHYFADFSTQHDEEKMMNIIQKTWRKMSPEAHALALTIPLKAECKGLVEKALKSD